jgi:hypothetical protein
MAVVSKKSDRALGEKVFDGSSYRPFGELSAADARQRQTALGEMTGFGPMMRVRPVAEGWGRLADLMEERGISRVAELEDEEVEQFAVRLWVIHPGGSFLSDPPAPPPEQGPSPEQGS